MEQDIKTKYIISQKANDMREKNPEVETMVIARLLNKKFPKYSESYIYDLCKPKAIQEAKDAHPELFNDKKEETPASILSGVVCEDDKHYFYNSADKKYIVYSPWRARPLIVPEETHSAILREYSNLSGGGTTINKMCETFGMDRPEMRWYLRVFHHTKDALPFSDEEMTSSSDDDLVNKGIQIRRGSIRRKIQKKEWEETIKYADIGRNFEAQISMINNGLAKALNEFDSEAVKHSPSDLDTEDNVDVIGLYDLHFGKMSFEGKSNQSIRNHVKSMIHETASKSAYLVFGGDTFNVDTYLETTTSGTPQSNDGPAVNVVAEAWKEIIAIIYSCIIRYKNLKIVIVPGNHDMMSSIHMNAAIKAMSYAWNDNSDCNVKVISNGENIVFDRFGSSLFIMTHGHLFKKANMSAMILSKLKGEIAGVNYFYHFSGHEHHSKTIIDHDDAGIVNFKFPSPSVTDQWHEDNGFGNSVKAIRMMTFNKNTGHISTHNRNL